MTVGGVLIVSVEQDNKALLSESKLRDESMPSYYQCPLDLDGVGVGE
jgi:hypothetical protein